jgi:hypothetical protein
MKAAPVPLSETEPEAEKDGPTAGGCPRGHPSGAVSGLV